MAHVSEHIEWLNLIDRSGPFLVPAVLEETFPQGLEKVETPRKQRLRNAYEEWRDAIDESDPQLSEIHNAWITMVLQDMLEYENEVLVDRSGLVGKCVYKAPEHGVEIAPDFALRGDDGNYKILISYWPPETDLEKPVSVDSWPSSPLDRMTLLCRANNVRTGLITDGERWMIVNAPVGGVSGYGAWLARLWWQEPITLKAFQSLLGVRRFFGSPESTLDILLERSSAFQEEVTDTLGEQVRRAVEILIQSLGRADQDRNGELLKDVEPKEIYEAGLTVMMRLVFTLCAEERGLLLLGDPIYDQYYAISTLRSILREEADRLGVEVLERRHDAWSRLLSTFRAIFGGIEHESLRMPAMGGSLFDPDRFPFLEGRAKGTKWKEHSATPLPIDNRTVLLLLDALQVLEQRGGAQLLSYRALDVEQIGHVYEGLLECTVAKLNEVTIGLIGSQKVRHPSTTLRELEALSSQGTDKIIKHLAELTGRAATTIKKALEKDEDESIFRRLIHACGGDEKLAGQLSSYANLFDEDSWGTFLVYRAGSFAVVRGSSRRETGAHYTPKTLTEPIVQHTLEPLVYIGPAEGKPQNEWRLKSSAELLSLKICDMAMGSAAFLVQACRWLGERVVEAWEFEEKTGKYITMEGETVNEPKSAELLPKDKSERILIARRLVASRCLCGVDINPMAVELGKMSLWLVTMMKNRPFNFLDHALKCGDSLLGVSNLEQIANFSLRPGQMQATFATIDILNRIESASVKRKLLENLPSNDLIQVGNKNSLFVEAESEIVLLKVLSDCLIAFEILGFSDKQYEDQRITFAIQVEKEMKKPLTEFIFYSSKQLHGRKPFHWPIEFPEVFAKGGFDAFIGNPPFMGSQRMTGVFGNDYRNFIVNHLADGRRGQADLCAYFFLRAFSLLREEFGVFGLLSTNTIAQGDTRQVGLDHIVSKGKIFRAISSIAWPGAAMLEVAQVWFGRFQWLGETLLDGKPTKAITSYLTAASSVNGMAYRLAENDAKSFIGFYVLGMGFVLTAEEAKVLLAKDPRNVDVIFPFLNGDDINSRVDQSPSRWVINFHDWPLEKAAQYAECFSIVETKVKPEREKNNREVRRKYWWHYAEKCPALCKELKLHSRVLVHPLTSKYNSLVFYDPDIVFSHMTVVLALDKWSDYSILQSDIHWNWVLQYGNKFGNTPQYTPSDCVVTFPFPHLKPSELEQLGKTYYETRHQIIQVRQEGLTKIYNCFHDQGEQSHDIIQLRKLYVNLNNAVAGAYGWSDLELEHDFHETKQGIRYTISETARREVLDRLLALNHQRYEEEVKAGLHDKKTPKKTSSKKKVTSESDEPELF